MAAPALSPPVTPAARFTAARQLLRHHFGYPDFRPAQRPVIASVLARQDTLAVLPTGGGKSICFQIPALALGGLTIVVSPLISLMQDQVAAARSRGLPAAALHSALSASEQRSIRLAIQSGRPGLLYVSPERLGRLAPWLQQVGVHPTLLAIDEAHCIAEWGHDFRPAYRALGSIRRRLGSPPVVALTGSATPAVRQEIMTALGGRRAWDVHIGSFDRRNLWFSVRRVRSEAERIEALLQLLREDDRVAIVYTPTRSVTEAVSWRLRHAGFRAAPYHAGLSSPERRATLEAFLDDQLQVVVATCAFGMGIDKPTVRLVVHWTMPGTPESYYQEAGRAGRDGLPARCVLLYRNGDAVLHRRQLEVTFPDERLLERIWYGPAPTSVPRSVLASAERLRHELHPEHGPIQWDAVRRRRKQAEGRIAAVRAYAERRACRRAALLEYFGERLHACAGCDRCSPPQNVGSLPLAVRQRLARLQHAVGRRSHAGGGRLFDGATLLRLAAHPPTTAAQLADVPGVGAALAARLGATLMAALHGDTPVVPQPAPLPSDSSEPATPLGQLRAWRRSTAQHAGLPEILILGDAALRRLAKDPPTTRAALSRTAHLGPAALAAWGQSLLATCKSITEASPASL